MANIFTHTPYKYIYIYNILIMTACNVTIYCLQVYLNIYEIKFEIYAVLKHNKGVVLLSESPCILL